MELLTGLLRKDCGMSEGTLVIVVLTFFVAEQTITLGKAVYVCLGIRDLVGLERSCPALLRKRERLRPVSSPALIGPVRRANAVMSVIRPCDAAQSRDV